jgi:hypothetical protein
MACLSVHRVTVCLEFLFLIVQSSHRSVCIGHCKGCFVSTTRFIPEEFFIGHLSFKVVRWNFWSKLHFRFIEVFPISCSLSVCASFNAVLRHVLGFFLGSCCQSPTDPQKELPAIRLLQAS